VERGYATEFLTHGSEKNAKCKGQMSQSCTFNRTQNWQEVCSENNRKKCVEKKRLGDIFLSLPLC
jgi:hypothetical protein